MTPLVVPRADSTSCVNWRLCKAGVRASSRLSFLFSRANITVGTLDAHAGWGLRGE